MNLASQMPQKSINTLKVKNHDFLRSSYYGSIGRPDRSVKRRSAVELLEESKPFYVKSESVLDGRQELKNADHLHVRSPTRVEVVSTLPRRGGHHCLPLSCYAICPTCYPHATATNKDHLHLDPFQLQTLQEHYLLHYERLQRESRDALRGCVQPSRSDRKLRRSSVPSPATFQIHSFQMERRAFDHSTSSPFATVARLPAWTEGNAARIDLSPPPLPPKSPRTVTKPIRPHDFPQRLKGEGSPELTLIQPPPPPRRNSDNVQDVHSKLRRLIRDRPSLKVKMSGGVLHQSPIPVTLPSPLLPTAPPTDVIMESPMSDSGPIISPPPAFSTPVTPMIERQNSSASEKSIQNKLPPLFPASAAMSVISASSGKSRKSSAGMGGSGNASISDVSMRHSSKSTSDSTSSMSRTPGDKADASSEESSHAYLPPLSIANKLTSITKSVTENALSRVASFDGGVREPWDKTPLNVRAQARHHSISSQTEGTTMGMLASPVRRPILRSKSDLSHRYKKTGSAARLLRNGGFTLVPVDFGNSTICGTLPPPQEQQKFSTSSMDSRRHDSRRASRSSLELERFFDRMGLDSTDNSPLQPKSLNFINSERRSSESSPIFFSSMSSVDSIPRREGSVDSGDSPGQRYAAARTYSYIGPNPSNPSQNPSNLVVQSGEPSIVERNARVIKWLFNCRKAVENTRLRR